MRADRIEIVEPDPSWPALFAEQAGAVAETLGAHLTRPVEHIGSTAVPGLPAKPIIDMLAVVDDHDAVGPALDRLVERGWCRAPEPGDALVRKHSLCRPGVEHRTHHLHVVEPGWGWPDLLVFRDYLRAHPAVAADYGVLKRRLAGADDRDRPRYRAGKSPMITETMIDARRWYHDRSATMIDIPGDSTLDIPGAALRTWTTGERTGGVPVIMINGGPGLPGYLDPVAMIIDDLTVVHRYDQRGTGGSPWEGEHTVAHQVADIVGLLDAWDHRQAVLIGHSYGTDLACQVLLAHPDRVAGLVLLSGPFTEPWRAECRATERARRGDERQARLDELEAVDPRTEAEETEFLALNWFTDHADPDRAWGWALDSARVQRPVNYAMNAQLNADKRTVALEDRLDDLRRLLPARSMVIGGAGDPRPASALLRFGDRTGCPVTIIPAAGHDPWLEAPTAFATALRAAVRTLTTRTVP